MIFWSNEAGDSQHNLSYEDRTQQESTRSCLIDHEGITSTGIVGLKFI